MGKADIITKEYMRKPHVFADAFNYYLYDGRPVIKPSELKEMDTAEILSIVEETAGGKGKSRDYGVQRYRDVLKSLTVMSGSEASYILLGVENQTDIHYAMPVKNMVYDAIQYASQVSRAAAEHRRERSFESRAEFLSGFAKEDKLQPVITLVIHFGADPWDGPRSLHEMLAVQNETVLQYAQDYRIHLIDPWSIAQKDFKKFASSLREVLNYIKYSKDEKGLARLLREDERLKSLEAGAARVIETITNMDFAMNEKTEVVNVCQAVEDMMESREQIGRQQGELIGRKQGELIGRQQGELIGRKQGELIGRQQGTLETLINLVHTGIISVADAVSEAGVSREVFEEKMQSAQK